MLRTVLNPISDPAHATFVEKKSEFISDTCRLRSMDELQDFVLSIRQQHPKARHVAYAAICGESEATFVERMSDDGEPSGTAGRPILDMLRSEHITDTAICVTRYFGGILLGSGGLIRAYAQGAKLCLQEAQLGLIAPCIRYSATITYSNLQMFERICKDFSGSDFSASFSDVVEIEISIPEQNAENFEQRIIDQFHTAVVLHKQGIVRSVQY